MASPRPGNMGSRPRLSGAEGGPTLFLFRSLRVGTGAGQGGQLRPGDGGAFVSTSWEMMAMQMERTGCAREDHEGATG